MTGAYRGRDGWVGAICSPVPTGMRLCTIGMVRRPCRDLGRRERKRERKLLRPKTAHPRAPTLSLGPHKKPTLHDIQPLHDRLLSLTVDPRSGSGSPRPRSQTER